MARKTKQYDIETRRVITPANKNQQRIVDSILFNPITVITGPAGSGKTILSIYTLYQMYKSGQIDQIYIIRLITETFSEKLGALPGEKEEKLSPFMGPIEDNLNQFLPPGEVRYLIENKKIEVLPVSHCRGRSFSNKGVIVEEAQNLTSDMVVTIATRLAKGSRLVFNGDPYQVDFRDRNGILYLIDLFTGLDGAGVVQLYGSEIVRHPMISSILTRARSLTEHSY